MYEQKTESELIEALTSALEEFRSTTLDDCAAGETATLLRELKQNPESAVNTISQAFNSQKTAITDSPSQKAVSHIHIKVEAARKSLGNFYAWRRISTRAKS